jgi:hypothetical protein
MDGGRAAAGGFLYQYLRTAEAVLIALTTDDCVHACRVEGDPYPDEVSVADIVDFDLIDRDGNVLRSVQVKGGASGAQLHVGEVFTILTRLVARGDAEKYVLLTNKRISTGATELAGILATDQSLAERRAALQSFLHGVSGRHLADLTDEQVQRLGRCEISVDRRSRTELRDALLHAVRAARRNDGRGIGTQSGGLLLAYLHWEIHRRAASPEDAVWAISDVRKLLHLDDRALVEALGERDWGGVLGLLAPIPGIPRTELLEAIAGALQPFRPNGRTVGRCAITGLSGIGKSSLAARYVAEYLDAYDVVFWFDASNPPYTLIQGFRAAAGKLGLDSDVSAELLRTGVHERLSRLAGRWLIIFDDAKAAVISSWVPRIGDGDVLITSIDGTGGFGNAHDIPIGGMSPDEATRLLVTRLGVTTETTGAEAELVRRLAAALEYWPLALELAAAYLRSCGYAVSDIPFYIEKLILRSLGDRPSIPDGYPATLIAAIDMAAAQLKATLDADEDLQNLVSNMIMEGAFLAARQIPVHLLVSASQIDLDAFPPDAGPIIFEDPLIHEAIRCIRSVSFARMDEPLPRRENDMPTAEHTISMNSVLQEVMRARAENHPTFPTWKQNLERLALHLDHWLTSAVHNGESDKSHMLVPHVDTLIHHLRRLHLTSGRIPLLIGNLAGIYVVTNDPDTAIGLLEDELQLLLNAETSDEFLMHQARLHLAQALAVGEQIDTVRAARVIGNLEYVAIYSQRLAVDADTQDTASRFCLHSQDILANIADAGHSSQASSRLTSVFSDVLSRLPESWEMRAREAGRRADEFLSSGMPEQAEHSCRPHMTPLRYGSNLQLELHRLLIEALVFQKKWDEVRTEIAAFAARMGNEPLHRQTAEKALHNFGLTLASRALLGDDQLAADLFAYLMSVPCFASVVRVPRSSNVAKFSVLNLVLALVEKSPSGIVRYKNEVQFLLVNDSSLAGDRAWQRLANTAISRAA